MRSNIVYTVLPDAIKRFLEKNEDYGEGSDEFGDKAQIMDISRKYKKLHAAIWDGQELTGEQVEEIAEDMIAHLLLLLEYRRFGPRGSHTYLPAQFTAEEWSEAYEDGMAAM